jgi:lysozyme
MKRSLAISFAIAVFLTISGMGQPLYAQPTPKSRTLPTPIPRTLPAACCSITAINTSTGVVTAKENATGKIFQFKVANSALLNSLKIGQGVYANFATGQVSLDGSTMCCSIMPPAPPPLPPAGGSSVKLPASPPTKTNPPPGSGGATTPPGNKILANPSNLAIPRETAPGAAPPASPAQPPVISPVGGAYYAQDFQSGVTIADATTKAVVYYTTDGSTPTTSSTKYSAPIPVNSTTTIRAMATASGMTNSPLAIATYTILVPPPPTCPAGSVLEGVDVSKANGTVNWKQVRASGRTFAYARATESLNYVDPSFSQNYAAIKAAGLVRGASHFFHPDQDPVAQANLLMSTIGTLQPGDLPPALDVEITGGQTASTIVAGINTWMARVKAQTGLTPILYSAAGFLSPLGSTVSTLSNYPLWAANWNVSCPTIPSTWQKWVLWQYSASGTVPGISGAVDLNRFNGTLAGLDSLAKLSTSQQQPPSGSGTSTSGTAASNVSPVINEIEAENTTLHQFIELFNPGSSAYDLKGHCVVFRSATATSDTLLVSFKTTTLIPSNGYFLLALPNSTGPTPNATYSSPIANAGGVVALRDGAVNAGSVIDSVAYGSASNPFFLQTASAPSAAFPGTSISRWPNGSNTHNNSMDFKLTTTPTPGQPNQ